MSAILPTFLELKAIIACSEFAKSMSSMNWRLTSVPPFHRARSQWMMIAKRWRVGGEEMWMRGVNVYYVYGAQWANTKTGLDTDWSGGAETEFGHMLPVIQKFPDIETFPRTTSNSTHLPSVCPQ